LNRPCSSCAKAQTFTGTQEQFHSDIKADLDLERLPIGKFDTNILVVSLAA